jgi:hypothetical protein
MVRTSSRAAAAGTCGTAGAGLPMLLLLLFRALLALLLLLLLPPLGPEVKLLEGAQFSLSCAGSSSSSSSLELRREAEKAPFLVEGKGDVGGIEGMASSLLKNLQLTLLEKLTRRALLACSPPFLRMESRLLLRGCMVPVLSSPLSLSLLSDCARVN